MVNLPVPYAEMSCKWNSRSERVRCQIEHEKIKDCLLSDHFPIISEDYRRLPNISEKSSKMFRLYRNKCRFVQQLKRARLGRTYDVIDILTRRYRNVKPIP